MPTREPHRPAPLSASHAPPAATPDSLPAGTLGARGSVAMAAAAGGGALVQWAAAGAHGFPWAAVACAAAAGALAAAAHRLVFARHVTAPFAALAERLRAEQAQRARA